MVAGAAFYHGLRACVERITTETLRHRDEVKRDAELALKRLSYSLCLLSLCLSVSVVKPCALVLNRRKELPVALVSEFSGFDVWIRCCLHINRFINVLIALESFND